MQDGMKDDERAFREAMAREQDADPSEIARSLGIEPARAEYLRRKIQRGIEPKRHKPQPPPPANLPESPEIDLDAEEPDKDEQLQG